MTRALMDRHVDSLAAGRTLALDERDVIEQRVLLHDETLRAGEETVGVAFSVDEKVQIARRLIDAGFTSFSPGFAAASPREQEAARAILALGGPAAAHGPLCRPLRADIEAAMACGFDGVAMFISISDSHPQYKPGTDAGGAHARMLDGIGFARSRGLRVRFAFEDATRAPLERIKRFVGTAVEAGATGGICIADTVGILTPLTTRALVTEVIALLGDVPLFVRFHDDLGMATANSLVACVAGACYVAGTLCSLGKRAGTACHEEVAVGLRVLYGIDSGVDLDRLTSLARRVSDMVRVPG
jgi:isopropylmalate/homocitrate/citramalate synthase